MRPTHSTRSFAQIRGQATAWLQQTLLFQPLGNLAPETLVSVVLAAACWRCALSKAAERLRDTPGAETLRQAILAHLPPTAQELQEQVATSLIDSLPRGVQGRRLMVAVDLHLQPFYGKKTTKGLYRGAAKAGTKRFWASASVILLCQGRRDTVGVVPVVNKQPLVEVLELLLGQLRRAQIWPQTMRLDREFYCAEVVGWLQDRRIGFVIPMIRRGKRGSDTQEPTGTQPFFRKTCVGFSSSCWQGRRGGRRVTVSVASVWFRRKHLVYVFWGWRPGSLREVAQVDRRRFGIETGFRQWRQSLIRTSSTHAAYRYLLMAVAALLRNLWVWQHEHWLRWPAPGCCVQDWERLPLETMLDGMLDELKAEWGTYREIELSKPVQRKNLKREICAGNY